MTIDLDGIFRVYSLRRTLDPKEKWSIWWNSSLDKCSPKGLCGLNGFCNSNGTEADCKCLPGFASVNPSSWASGCVRNFTAESCKITNGDGNTKYYSLSPLENTIWEDDSYSVLQLNSRKECEDACLQDCNCEAALYKGQQCKKQRLPLRFGRRLPSDPNVAFIKVGESISPNTEGVPTHSDNPPKKPKKELRLDILIIGVSLVVFSLMILAISGVLVYRNHVWAYKKISAKLNVELGEEAALRTFTFAELEQSLELSFSEEEAVLEEWVYDFFQTKELDK
ncbi:G-type lectin S-receptor-like serine/threonine-protein kinase LECRK1 [Camellia lanceoleosa]|uniref:G-type lectin S-receptor-like serine/threonine-protein kinase LECRK1 n=1 Tax=Camellia lanceoleosa TaxID=1840588 RepID=A0ACC0GAD7_9ERIC|nr:G-type lectin S-receptor-like serine/threonine-protein kinase LECRK1 [Camellia lanceoleosa]